jgi:LDH2 family malate/lactate/ureidoglycolate dehydrogenase
MFGGHKGYGLAASVEVFTALLSGAAVSPLTYPKTPDGRPLPANLGHFFGAWRIDCFRPVDEFKGAMDDYQRLLRGAPKLDGQDRIFIPGDKEREATERHLAEGIPLNQTVAADLSALAGELQVDCPW